VVGKERLCGRIREGREGEKVEWEGRTTLDKILDQPITNNRT
jgi:hypothetical protein